MRGGLRMYIDCGTTGFAMPIVRTRLVTFSDVVYPTV